MKEVKIVTGVAAMLVFVQLLLVMAAVGVLVALGGRLMGWWGQ